MPSSTVIARVRALAKMLGRKGILDGFTRAFQEIRACAWKIVEASE